MLRLTILDSVFTNAAWPGPAIQPGQQVELKVDAPNITGDQFVEFRVLQAGRLLDLVRSDPGSTTKKWKAQNLPGTFPLTFCALLREKPGPTNGHQGVVASANSPNCNLQGYKLDITSLDACFVPNQEALELKYKVTDPGAAAKKGRYEIWGERYPTDKPLYVEEFDPAAGDQTWNPWKGKANQEGCLKDKFITPEFSPYRLRVIIGPDADSVKDPEGKGLGLVAVAEKQFEIDFMSIRVRLQANLGNAVQNALDEALKIEPCTNTSKFAVSGRLPLETEPKVNAGWAPNQPEAPERSGVGRIRIPGQRHIAIGESLNQGRSEQPPAGSKVFLHQVTDPYMDAGSTKYSIDHGLYDAVRPELPVELEARLKSKDPEKNKKPEFGVFEKEAVGPALFEIDVNDVWQDELFTSSGTAQSQAYFRNAATKVKYGKHNEPKNNGGNPVFGFWQQRFQLAADTDRETPNSVHPYVTGSKELTVYLNRAKLMLDEDYTEESANKIKLKDKFKAGTIKSGDVIWLSRKPSDGSITVVDRWQAYPPGPNTHVYYGGERGRTPEDSFTGLLRKEPSGGNHIGGGANFPYTDHVNLDPDKVDADKRERVESQAIIKDGDQKGLAGVIFSPSTIAGDCYVLEATLRGCPYLRDFGFVTARPEEPWVTGKTGKMTVWRVMKVSESWRLARIGTGGLAFGVGEQDTANANTRTHPGDGRGMNFDHLVELNKLAFNEWVIEGAAGQADPHRNVDLDRYRQYFNDKAAGNELGFYNIADATKVTNRFVQWDHYREYLPPGIPDNRQNVANWYLQNQVTSGADPNDAKDTVNQGINDWDAADPAGSGAPDSANVANSAGSGNAVSEDQYKNWVKSRCKQIANDFLDIVTPQDAAPKAQRVLRWPELYWDQCWVGRNSLDGLGLAGYCRGSGQAFFFSATGNADTFEHELGHSVFCTHFAAGGAGNFCWKHHDHKYPSCIMGYYNGSFTVPGVGITINTGNRNLFCPKCLMRMRGWDEEKLPCNWAHANVF